MKTQMYMNTENKQELYVSPKVEVIEVKARQVICQSGETPGFNLGDQGYDKENW